MENIALFGIIGILLVSGCTGQTLNTTELTKVDTNSIYYLVGMGSRTGNDGTFHLDYSNFKISDGTTVKEIDWKDWQEYVWPAEPSQHYWNSFVFHTEQTTQEETGADLILLNNPIKPGYSLSYDVNYLSGSGNMMSRIIVNGKYLDEVIGQNKGAVGYWNGFFELGNTQGEYNVRMSFLEDKVEIEVKSPLGTIIKETSMLNTINSYSKVTIFGVPEYRESIRSPSTTDDQKSIVPSTPSSSSWSSKNCYVSGYCRRDGRCVSGYWRSC